MAGDRELRRAERERERRRRRRRAAESESEDEEESAFPPWKTAMVAVVIVGCFAVLYPKMFHPMLMYALGFNKKEKDPEPQFPHPGMHGGPPKSGRHSFGPDPHIHAGPHPAMRGAGMGGAGAGGMGGKGAGGGKGMWHWMLPFYTVGVIVFLLFTLSKILWKEPSEKRKKKGRGGRKRVEEWTEEESEEEEDGVEGYAAGKLSNKELKGLQKRLNETETAMHRILEQLEQISGTVDAETADSVKKMTMETLTNLAKVEANQLENEKEDRKGARKKKAGKKGGGGGKEEKYLADLERALTDFKKFTQDYVEKDEPQTTDGEPKIVELGDKTQPTTSTQRNQEKSQKESENDASEEENSEEEDSRAEDDNSEVEDDEESGGSSHEQRGFDPMDSEDKENLRVPEGEGEIIHINNSPQQPLPSPHKGVRKRVRKA